MGYSIATPVRSEKAHREMLAFLKENYRPWGKVIGNDDAGGYITEPTSDLSYDHSKRKIGFDYNASGGERQYAFAIVRWIALKVGRRTAAKTPYYVYDGHERVGILVRQEPLAEDVPDVTDCEPGLAYCVLTDSTGYRLNERDFIMKELRMLDEEDTLENIRDELRRLDALWEKHEPETG